MAPRCSSDPPCSGCVASPAASDPPSRRDERPPLAAPTLRARCELAAPHRGSCTPPSPRALPPPLALPALLLALAAPPRRTLRPTLTTRRLTRSDCDGEPSSTPRAPPPRRRLRGGVDVLLPPHAPPLLAVVQESTLPPPASPEESCRENRGRRALARERKRAQRRRRLASIPTLRLHSRRISATPLLQIGYDSAASSSHAATPQAALRHRPPARGSPRRGRQAPPPLRRDRRRRPRPPTLRLSCRPPSSTTATARTYTTHGRASQRGVLHTITAPPRCEELARRGRLL